MMWAAISNTSRTALTHIQSTLTGHRYIDEVIQPHVVPVMQYPEAVFQHENAKPHSVRLERGFLQRHTIQVLP